MNILSFIGKLALILPSGLAGILGVIQAILKILKELGTLLADVLVPVLPAAQKIVLKYRSFINTIDVWFEKIKKILLEIIGVKTE